MFRKIDWVYYNLDCVRQIRFSPIDGEDCRVKLYWEQWDKKITLTIGELDELKKSLC